VHEYYTPWQVCADITAAVERLLPGVHPIRALEPSAGVGRFIHTTAPERWRWTAIELSPLSALILSQSVPRGTTVVTSSFEAWVNTNAAQRFDAIVSNPPYGPRGESITADKDKRFRTRAAYEYFLLRAMTLLRPGGIAAFLIPGGFLTGPSKRPLRERIAESAAMLGAFRLPSGIFPGARLTLDVVFLARREAEDYEPDDIFLDGRYFEAYPTHVLGELKASGRWGESEVIGDYTGLPAFEPRFTVAPPTPPALRVTRRPAEAPATPAPASAEPAAPIRHRGFRSLWTLNQLVADATARDPFRSDSFTAVPAAGWQAAVEDVVQSPRPKRDRLEWLRDGHRHPRRRHPQGSKPSRPHRASHAPRCTRRRRPRGRCHQGTTQPAPAHHARPARPARPPARHASHRRSHRDPSLGHLHRRARRHRRLAPRAGRAAHPPRRRRHRQHPAHPPHRPRPRDRASRPRRHGPPAPDHRHPTRAASLRGLPA
jgi:hypothetical protein